MPVLYEQTRKARAERLLERLNRGPYLQGKADPLLINEIQRSYKLWVETWITPEVIYLVPELKIPVVRPKGRKEGKK